jgi:hypothetical protein
MGLAAAAAVSLTFARGLHASLALRTERHDHLLSLGQMQDIELLQVERPLLRRAVDLQLVTGTKLLYNGPKVLGGLEGGAA